MRNHWLLAPVFAVLTLAGCQSTHGGGASPQTIVSEVKMANPDCTRLSLHCTQADGTAKTCASTAAERVGKASDAEDLTAMQTGEAVVRSEGAAVDVTVPILQKDGKWVTVCGVTMAPSAGSRDQAVAKAKVIALAVKARLTECCPEGCCK